MVQSSTCPSGHQWTSDSTTCPVCGSTAGRDTVTPSATESQLEGDQLPPPPGGKAPGPTLVQRDSRPEIPGFEILGELGRGGMGVVYRARQKSLDRIVALKMLLAGPLAGVEELSRLRAEAESIARLQHPNIVHVYDIGEHQGWTFIALEFLDGGNLAMTLDGQPRSPDSAAELTEMLARAVHAAHQRGVVHRDLKPANVLLTADGTPKITDFGLAKRIDQEFGQTRTGAVMGTPCYMAPEQAEGKSKIVGPATDVYALGAILYELLTGRPPFQSDSAFSIMLQVVQNTPIAPRSLQPSLPPALEQICLKCLNKNPGERFPSALALADELKRFRAQPPSIASAPELPPTQSSRRVGLWTGGIVAFAGAVLLLYHFAGDRRAKDASNAKPDSGNAVVGGGQAVHEPNADSSTAALANASGWNWSFAVIGSGGEVFDRLAVPSPKIGYVASRQRLYKSTDGGNVWSGMDQPSPGRVHVLRFLDEQNGWLGTSRLFQTTNGGASWTPVDLPDAETLTAVTGLDFDSTGAALAGGTTADGQLRLFRRADANASWQSIDPVQAGLSSWKNWYLGDVVFRDRREALAALFRGSPEEGVLVASHDGGQTWARQFQADADLYRVRFADPKRGWLVGGRGSFWTTVDAGESWTHVKATDVTASGVALSSDGKLGIAPLWQSEVLLTTDGQTWSRTAIGNGFGYSMPAAAIVGGRAVVLSADGKIAMSRAR